MEYNDLMEEAKKYKYVSREVNICDLLKYEDRDAIAKIVDDVIAREYGDDMVSTFKWSFSCSGYAMC